MLYVPDGSSLCQVGFAVWRGHGRLAAIQERITPAIERLLGDATAPCDASGRFWASQQCQDGLVSLFDRCMRSMGEVY